MLLNCAKLVLNNILIFPFRLPAFYGITIPQRIRLVNYPRGLKMVAEEGLEPPSFGYEPNMLTFATLRNMAEGERFELPRRYSRPDSLANCSLDRLSIPRHWYS